MFETSASTAATSLGSTKSDFVNTILSAIATSRTNHLLAAGTPLPTALTSGFHRALMAGSIALAASALLALRIANTRGDEQADIPVPEPESEPVPAK